MRTFYKIAYGRESIPVDNDEIEKVLRAMKENSGLLVLKQGAIDLRIPVTLVPDHERTKRYNEIPVHYKEEREQVAQLPDDLQEARNNIISNKRVSPEIQNAAALESSAAERAEKNKTGNHE